MFDFHKLLVYNKAKQTNKAILVLLNEKKRIDPFIRNQLKRASISSVINIAEGSGRFSKADKKNFYVISRGSIYECLSLFDILLEEQEITDAEYQRFYNKYTELVKMLYGMIKSMN